MRRILLAALAVAILLPGCTSGGESRALRDDASRQARDFVMDIVNENYVRALTQGTDGLKADLTVRDLQWMWLETQMQAGSFNSISGTYTNFEAGNYTCVLTADHRNRTVFWTLTYKEDGETVKLDSVDVRAVYKPEARVAPPEGIVQENVVVGEASGYPLNGRLTLPRNIGEGARLPAVVLVHNHGPWDMDASVFDNKPFRDIAYHLAANGIAVLRYDKITYRYPDELKDVYGNRITAELETVYDAAYARLLLAGDERIDQDRVFVLGHGLGGSLAPLICALYGYNGWISMAGSPRNLVELAIDTQMYAAERDGRGRAYRDNLRSEHEAAAELFLALVEMSFEEIDEICIFDISGYYLKSLIENAPEEFLELNYPALVLQGTNDFEVFFDRDFELYQQFLTENDNAEFRLYRGVNHMLMWSTMERPDIRDYRPAATVEKTVLDDIAEWINKN